MVLILMLTMVHGEYTGVLTDVLKPESIDVSGERLYVAEGAAFYVYSLKDLRLIAKFGEKGEGPGELKVVPMFSNSITAVRDQLIVEGMNKIIFFSKNGEFLKEARKKGGYRTFRIRPVKENYIAVRMISATEKDKKFYMALSLLDAEMNLIKELYRQEFPEKDKDIVMVTDAIYFAVYKDRIYVEKSEKGFVIEVFDSKGSSLFEIKKDFGSRKITGKDREAILKNLKGDNFVKLMVKAAGGWENFKKRMGFIYPGSFPPIQDIIVSDDRIYVSTYDRKGDKEKYIIMDLEGNILAAPYLPVPKESSFLSKTLGRGSRFYGIAGHKFYYLKENEDDEEWELHAIKIK